MSAVESKQESETLFRLLRRSDGKEATYDNILKRSGQTSLSPGTDSPDSLWDRTSPTGSGSATGYRSWRMCLGGSLWGAQMASTGWSWFGGAARLLKCSAGSSSYSYLATLQEKLVSAVCTCDLIFFECASVGECLGLVTPYPLFETARWMGDEHPNCSSKSKTVEARPCEDAARCVPPDRYPVAGPGPVPQKFSVDCLSVSPVEVNTPPHLLGRHLRADSPPSSEVSSNLMLSITWKASFFNLMAFHTTGVHKDGHLSGHKVL